MTADLPYALGCPTCTFHVEVSEEDPDASLSYLYDHIFSQHAGYDRQKANQLLAKARDLTAEQVDR